MQRQCRSRSGRRGCRGGRQSHWAGWLEQNSDVLAVSDGFGRFQAILFFSSMFSHFGRFFDVFGRFWSVGDLGFGPGDNRRRQVFEETLIALLSSCPRGSKLPWVEQIINDMRCLQQYVNLGRRLPDPTEDPYVWFDFIICLHNRWNEKVGWLHFEHSCLRMSRPTMY